MKVYAFFKHDGLHRVSAFELEALGDDGEARRYGELLRKKERLQSVEIWDGDKAYLVTEAAVRQ